MNRCPMLGRENWFTAAKILFKSKTGFNFIGLWWKLQLDRNLQRNEVEEGGLACLVPAKGFYSFTSRELR